MLACAVALVFAARGIEAKPDSNAASKAAGKRKAKPAGKIVKVEHSPPAQAPILGPRLAPVTIDFFMDPRERMSQQIDRMLRQLAERHPKRLRVVYRIVSKQRQSVWQAEAAREAFAQDRFREFMDAYYVNRRWPHRDDLRQIGEAAGLDVEALEQAVAPGTSPHAEGIVAEYWYSRRRRVNAIPGILVNGQPKLLSPGSLEELESLYDQAYEPARVRLDDGMRLEDLYPWLLREADASVEVPVGLVAGSVDGLSGRDKLPRGTGKLVGGLVDTSGALSRGPESAAAVLVFVCNFQTRHCKNMHDNIEELRLMFPDELRVVFHHQLDDEDKRQPLSRALAEGAECAHEQGAFWSYYDELFSSYLSTSIGADDILARAEKLELSAEPFAECMSSMKHAEKVEDARVAAERAGIEHTPSVVIGGRVYIGLQSTHVLRDLLLVELGPGLLETLLSD